MFMYLSLSANMLMLLKIIKMTSNSKYHLTLRMTLFISELCSWDLQSLNKQRLFLIPALNILLLLQFYAMTRHQETTNLKNTIQCKVVLCKETNSIRDAKLCLTICISLTQTKSCQKHHLNWLMDLQNFKVSSGKTIPASNLSRLPMPTPLSFNWQLSKTNVLSSNS